MLLRKNSQTRSVMDTEKIKQAVRLFLEGIGEDPEREGIKGTPGRVAKMCEDVLSGTGKDPHQILSTLAAERHDEIILLRDIPLYSFCEHHLLPFTGKAHIAYIPKGGRVTGLSKLARVISVLSQRLQVQERLTTQIADAVNHTLKPKGVMVIIEAEHLCMSIRGVRKPGTTTITSVVRGLFRENAATRAEAMSFITGPRK
ncbi:GTP cyclohydrolase I FolE [Candidatus Aerophobetes bacterium]|uniref:GTP cyclohydrolase 1 n=1 Tax=Aerophobetes bacterium TaxID=2030807 RepID=A0A523QMF1_UNCAE|nr:MAG: GTP cyclohydrolase I FolE [Candidatus Aerophobetes bacterium]